MRASCSSNISESLNHPYSMIPIDALHLFLHPFPLLSRALHLFLYSFNPSTLHSISTTKIILISPKQKLEVVGNPNHLPDSLEDLSKNLTGRGSLFPMIFFTSEIFKNRGAGTCHHFSLADPHHPGGPSCGTPNPGNNYKAEPFLLACFFLEFFR